MGNLKKKKRVTSFWPTPLLKKTSKNSKCSDLEGTNLPPKLVLRFNSRNLHYVFGKNGEKAILSIKDIQVTALESMATQKCIHPIIEKNVDKSAALQKLPGCHCARWIFIPSWNYAFLIKTARRWSWKGHKFCFLCLVAMFEGAFLVDIWALQPAPKRTALTHCLPVPALCCVKAGTSPILGGPGLSREVLGIFAGGAIVHEQWEAATKALKEVMCLEVR